MLKLESFYSRQLAQIDNPLLTSLVINKFTKMGAEDYYAKKESVKTYPEYLFRMDDEQKWTKENTHENICVLPAYITQPFDATAIECINNYFVYSFNDREILYQNLLDWQKKQFSNPLEKPEKYMKHAKDRIRFFSMVYEEDKESLADEMIVELDKIAKSSINVPYGEEWLEKYKGASSDGEGDGEVVKEKGVEGVLKTALNQEGITENPSGSNNVIFNTAFYGHEVSGDGYPWCCAFVWWCFEKSGNGNLVPKTAGCAYMESHISEYGGKKITKMTDAKRGDLVIFRGGQHIGIVVENKGNGNLVTIEGNTTPENGTGSEYNGGCVAKRNRNISASGITAVLRPKYPASSTSTTEEKGGKATTESKKK